VAQKKAARKNQGAAKSRKNGAKTTKDRQEERLDPIRVSEHIGASRFPRPFSFGKRREAERDPRSNGQKTIKESKP
jgi:hypothetical protein